MRQGQQNRRGRGRNNNHSHSSNNNNNQHRKSGQNPLSRSYESTGPDTKIRGTPAHIAEKYMQLARDAHSSGDPVLAENYLQHAEHYNRIIMTYREQQIQNGEVPSPQTQVGRFRPGGDDEFGDEEGGDDFGNMQPGGSQPMRQNEQQPRFEGGGQRYEERQPRSDRPDQPRHNRDRGEQRNFDRGGDRPDRGQDRGDRPERVDRQDRGERQDRPERFDRNDRGDRPERVERADRGERPERAERVERGDRPERVERERVERPERASPERREAPERVAAAPAEAAVAGDAVAPRRRERAPMPTHEQPEFLRRPVRRPRREAAAEGEEAPTPAETTADE